MQDCVVPKLGFPRQPTPLEVGEELPLHPSAQAWYCAPLGSTPRVAGVPSIENRIGVRTWIVQCAVFTAVMLREFSEPPRGSHRPKRPLGLVAARSRLGHR